MEGPIKALRSLIFSILLAMPVIADAQHEGHQEKSGDTVLRRSTDGKQQDNKKQVDKKQDHRKQHNKSEQMKHDQPGVHEVHDGGSMSHAFSRNLPMNRNGSGTAWLPDEAPMFGYMYHAGKWMYMAHGNLFLRYNNQDIARQGSRGGKSFDAPNWLMGMAQRPVGKRGLFRVSAMMSLDPLTVGLNGYPLLFQSGETYKGVPLVDRQHPHDLFAELSIGYTHMFTKEVDVFAYIGYPGEPALGGTAFMHRPSSLYNPDAPLGHHWQDATHITFGVATAGFRYRNWKLEGSVFTGREPDESRYGFDKPRFDSWSGRISYNPTRNLALQVSQAVIKSPELTHPGEDVRRTNASVIHVKRLGNNRMINSAVVWGFNNKGGGHREHSFLLESAFNARKNTVYGKYEFVEKSSEELQLDENLYEHDTRFPVNALTIGYNRNLFSIRQTDFSIGTRATFFQASSRLHSLYGSAPWAFQVFVRVNPALMRMQ